MPAYVHTNVKCDLVPEKLSPIHTAGIIELHVHYSRIRKYTQGTVGRKPLEYQFFAIYLLDIQN